MNMGGLYKRMGPGPIMNFVKVGDIDTILARVEKLGGKIMMPKSDIPSVGLVAVIQDTEENIIGLWTPEVGLGDSFIPWFRPIFPLLLRKR